MDAQNLRTEDIDKLGQAILTLTKELWIVKDRVRVLEAALADAGVLSADTVDTFQPDEQLSELLDKECAQLIEQVLTTLDYTEEKE